MITEYERKLHAEHKARRLRMAISRVEPKPAPLPPPPKPADYGLPVAAIEPAPVVEWQPKPPYYKIQIAKIPYIQQIVAERYRITRVDILSDRRDKIVIRPRHISMYLAKCMTLQTLSQIGRKFNGRDHTTVMHAVHKIEKMAETNEKLRQDLEEMKSKIMEMK